MIPSLLNLQQRIPQHEALTHALALRVGDEVDVQTWQGWGGPQYHGPGVVSIHRSHYDSHIVWLDHGGVCINVLLPNGNSWLYPALAVIRKEA